MHNIVSRNEIVIQIVKEWSLIQFSFYTEMQMKEDAKAGESGHHDISQILMDCLQYWCCVQPT